MASRHISSSADASTSTPRVDSTSAASSSRLPAVPANISSQFSQSQLALAFTIQKSKPADTSTLEYCQQLRKRIITSQAVSNSGYRYVDSAEFWKDQYSKIYAENKRLEDKVLCLEEGTRLLKETLGRDEGKDLQQGPSFVQQMLGQSYGLPLRVARKRQASHDVETWLDDQESHQSALSSPTDDDLLRLSSYVLRLARQRLSLEKLINDSEDLKHLDEAISQVLQLLKVLESSLPDCCLPFQLLRTHIADPQILTILQQLMHQISLSYQSAFKALNYICYTIPGRAKKATIVYHMVHFISSALNLLATSSACQSSSQNLHPAQHLRNKRARKEQESEYAISKYISYVLTSIFTGLEWKVGDPGHCDLLEGLLFCVLRSAGRLLSGAVFLEHVAASSKQGNISQGGSPSDAQAAKFESRYFMPILHAALGGKDKRDLVKKTLVSERGAKGQGDSIVSGKRLVQSTLVKSVVGETNFESLKMPTLADTDGLAVEAGPGVEPYGDLWLFQMVHALVGWDDIVK